MTVGQVAGIEGGGVPVALSAKGAATELALREFAPTIDGPPSEITTQPEPTAFLLLGLDDQGRPHASQFTVGDEDRVRAAGEAMQFAVLPVTGAAMAELVSKLPSGKMFASGKAFVPFAKQELFDRLVAYLPIKARPVKRASTGAKPKTGGAQKVDSAVRGQSTTESALTASVNAYAAVRDGAKFKPNALPSGFDQIKVGSVVLASESRDDGWWTAVVIENKGDGLWLLRCEDFEDIEPFFRRPEQLALMHPSFKGE